MTGVAPETSGKRLELLREAFPKTSRIAVLWNPSNPLGSLERKETEAAARKLHLTVQWLDAHSPGAIDAGFEAASKARADALIVFPDPVLVAARAQIIGLAAKHRLPTVYVFREDAEAGGLMSYGASVREQVRRAATFVDKILKGAKPADLPVEQARTFELVVNARTAKALGVTLPQALLLRADHIIQ